MSNITVKSSEARTHFRDLLDQVLAGKGDVVIERNGKDVAVLIPAVDYAELKEALAELRAVREASAAYEEWKLNPSVAREWDEVDSELEGNGETK